MTCITVLNDKKGALWFASDRRITAGDQILVNHVPKTKLKNNIIVAGAGTAWVCDLILEVFEFPEIEYDDSENLYVHKIFMPELLAWLRKEGYVDKNGMKLNTGSEVSKANKEDEDYGIILLGIYSSLYELIISDSSIYVMKVGTPHAIGCGGAYALGSLRTSQGLKMKVKDRLVLACKVAAQCSSGCDDNIDIVTNKELF